MNRSSIRLIGGLAGIFLALAAAGTVSAYWKQTPATVVISGPSGEIDCNDWYAFTATVRDANGDPIAKDGPVDWTFVLAQSDKDHIAPKQSRTDKDGVADTRIKFACVPGERIIRATANQASAQITVNIVPGEDDDAKPGKGPKGSTHELPRTSTAPDARTSGGLLPAVIALMALLAGSGLVIRRLASPRH